MKYRPDIDGLRAVSIVAVLLFHAGFAGVRGGFAGVDIFFVISGYLITGLLLGDLSAGRFSLMHFYERRIRRIFPALAAVSFATFVAAYGLFLPMEFAQYGKTLVAASLSASNLLFWRETNYFDIAATLKPLLHTWSLGVEEQFYVFFPVGLYIIHRFLKARFKVWIALGWVASFAIVLWAVNNGQQIAAFYLLPARAWELLTGAALAAGMVPAPKKGMTGLLIGLTGAVAVAASVVWLKPGLDMLAALLIAPVLGAGCLIHAGAVANPVTKILSLRPVVFIGRISYSLYLWHWPMLVFAKYYLIREPELWQTAAVMAAVLAVSALSWKFIEQPFRGRDRAWARKLVFGCFFGVNIILCVMGLWAWKTSGAPQRLPAEVVRLAKADKGVAGRLDEFHSGERQVLGDAAPAKQTVLLWGDSHANSIAPAVDAAAKAHRRGVLMLKKAGCLPTTDFTVPQSDYCLDFDRAVVEVLKAHPEIKTVIVDARWSAYLRWWTEGKFIDPDTLKSRFRQGVVALIHDLRAEGKKVVLVTEPPHVMYYVPSVLARQALYHNVFDMRPDVGGYLKDQAFNFGIFDELRKSEGLNVIYLHTSMCGQVWCEVTDKDGRSLYFDGNHLSTVGAERLTPLFDEIFK